MNLHNLSNTPPVKKPATALKESTEKTLDHGPVKSTASFFSTKYLKNLPEAEFKKMEKILAADPYLNGGKGQTGDKVITASATELPLLIERYSAGMLHTGKSISPLSTDAKKAFEALANWYIAYRKSFPDPSETEPLSNHLEYLKLTRNKEMKWGICINTDKEGQVRSAFSGQVLEAKFTTGSGQERIKFAWGEHLFANREVRGRGLGRAAVEAFEKLMTKNFGKADPVIIEVDNAFGILDRKDPKNTAYFDHSNLEKQRALWTDPDGQNMAMNPFERIKVWHKLGFQLVAVERRDLEQGKNSVAFPYNQVPMDKGADPCETIFLAVRISDPKIKEKIESGQITAKVFNSMYAAMQETITSAYHKDPAYRASQNEIKQLVGGEEAKVRLVNFMLEDQKTLNPEALAIMARTADHKFT